VDKKQITSHLKPVGIRPVKHRGQNFLISEIFLKKIIDSADIKPGETILEIGPGTGNLTLELLSAGAQVVTVEKDEKLARVLKAKMFENSEIVMPEADPPMAEKFNKNCKLKIITADILTFDETTIKSPYKIVANIPYYLTGKIIQKFLLSPNKPKEMILMVQKEVGERICAQVPKNNYLSVLVQFLAKTEILFKVTKENFWPKPKVDSVIIKITPSAYDYNFRPCDFINFLRVTFKQPRQTLFNNLKRDKLILISEIEKAFSEFNWPKNIRPQNLDLPQLQQLYAKLRLMRI